MPDLVNSGSITLADGTSGVNPPLGSYLDIGVEDHPAVSLDLEGAFTATLVIEAIAEAGPTGADWFTPVVLNAALVASSASLTAATRRFLSGAGVARVRLRCTSFTLGPIRATLRAGQGSIGASGGGGGGGGPVSVADGADTAEGSTADAAISTTTTGATPATGIGLWRGMVNLLVSLISKLPAALVGGRLDVNVGATGVTQPVSGTVSSAQSGTWTVQPGNTANTTAWKTDGSAVTQPVSGTVTANAGTGTLAVSAAALPLPAGASTETTLAAASAKLPAALVGARLDVNLGASPATVTVQGAGAAGAALAGNPVRVGISDLTSAQDWKQIAAGIAGNNTAVGLPAVAVVAQAGSNSFVAVGTAQSTGDAVTGAQGLIVSPWNWNGSSYDRGRNNVDVTLLASAARTTTQSGSITTYNLGAIKFILDMTVITASPSVTLTISETDLASGKTILLLSGAAVTTAVTNEYTVDPVVPAVANVSAQKRVPRTIFWQVTANSVNSGTYSLGSMQLPA